MAALSDRQTETDVSPRRRFTWGGAVALVGVVIRHWLDPIGCRPGRPRAVWIFVGTAMLAPAIARPLSAVIGRPLAGALGEAGKLGTDWMRSPRRTAQTASALIVGVALVWAISVFGASSRRRPRPASTKPSVPTCSFRLRRVAWPTWCRPGWSVPG